MPIRAGVCSRRANQSGNGTLNCGGLHHNGRRRRSHYHGRRGKWLSHHNRRSGDDNDGGIGAASSVRAAMKPYPTAAFCVGS
jgi:hypothetical protein